MFRPLVLAAAAWLAAAPAAQAAGPVQQRLQIEIELAREASFSGVERGRARLAQSLNLQVVLASDGVAMPHNPLDPDDGRRQLERAQRTQQKVQAALQRAGTAPAADPRAMQAQAQAMLTRCGQDRDCLMREAMAMNAARAVPSRPAAGAGDDGDADETVEAPYLMFTGAAACRLDAATKIDERIEGSFDDVQGVVPFTATTKADGRERDATFCPLLQAVLDTRSGRLWTHVLPVLRGVPGSSVRAEKGRRPQQGDGMQTARWHEGLDWLLARLANLSAGGSDKLERPLPGGKLDLRVRWRFGPV